MNAPAEPSAEVEKAPAEALALRARPRPVARFRRPLLIGVAGVGRVALSASAWVGLSPRRSSPGPKEAPPVISATGAEETLAALPKDYAHSGPPRLGPPLPGDLGRAIVSGRREGVEEDGGSDPEAKALAAEHKRVAAQVRQAREAGVMVQTSRREAGQEAPLAVTSSAPSPVARASEPSGGRAFLERPLGDTANSHVLVSPASPFQVLAGDVIAAALVTGLDSDLPGLVTAQVSQNVYDTVSGRYLLIPQGARLIGEYDSDVAFGQRRVLLAWRRLILPDGSSVQLDNLPAADTSGHAGLQDEVDFHADRLFKSAALSTLLGVGAQLSLGDEDSPVGRAVRRSLEQTASQAGQQITNRQLEVAPTLKVRPGWPLRVLVHKDLTLRPWGR
jgi:type IV secretion system protein VirB10